MGKAADGDICWSNRWHPSLKRCTKPGIYGKPDGQNALVRAGRWCEDHRFEGDVLLGVRPAGEPEGGG